MAYGGIQATGQVAVYSAETGLATVTGHPAWHADQREGHGDELVIDRTNRTFRANGHAWLKMPGQSLGAPGFLSRSKAAATRTSATTNRFVEILSDNYEFRTNWAVFRQEVRVSEIVSNHTGGTMTCALLTASFTGTNELHTLVAETNVVIQEEDKRFTGETAVFTGTNGILELTGKPNPTWQAGMRSGTGKLLRVDTQHDEMLVSGDALMRLPAEELGQAEALPVTSPAPRPKPAAPQFADITCEEYLVRPETALFRGGVHAISPSRMNMTCETLTVLAPPTGEKILIAEQRVIFDLTSEKGDKIHGTGDKAVYTNSITSTLTNDLLTLTGNPARLATTTATNENNVIVLDRTHNVLITRGDYRVFGTAKAVDTNLFLMPKNKLLK
jgi:lipopolysaccharide export system protein LptA